MFGKIAYRLPAVLKRKLPIKPISPVSIEPTLDPMSLRPFPRVLPVAFKALVRAPRTKRSSKNVWVPGQKKSDPKTVRPSEKNAKNWKKPKNN